MNKPADWVWLDSANPAAVIDNPIGSGLFPGGIASMCFI
jgi:hypothetical protein